MRALGALHVVLHAGEVARGPVYHLLDLGRGERLVGKQGRVRHDHVVGEREPRLQREVAPERVRRGVCELQVAEATIRDLDVVGRVAPPTEAADRVRVEEERAVFNVGRIC